MLWSTCWPVSCSRDCFFALKGGKPLTCPWSVEALESNVNAWSLRTQETSKLCFTLWTCSHGGDEGEALCGVLFRAAMLSVRL